MHIAKSLKLKVKRNPTFCIFKSCQLTLKQLHMPLPSLISTLYSANMFLISKYGLRQLLNSFLGFTNVITYNWNDTYLYGKSPVCRREWRLSSLRSLKLFSHMVHKYGLSPEKKDLSITWELIKTRCLSL